MRLESGEIENALTRVGDLLLASGDTCAVAILGGAALNLLGIVERTTRDVDVLALGIPSYDPVSLGRPDDQLPAPLLRAVEIVGRDLGLDADWMNTGPALQWSQGLPPALATRVHWKLYGEPNQGGLWVGLIDRYDLIFFKLFAAADSTGTGSVHYKDLIALSPTQSELEHAEAWVHQQDASPSFHEVLRKVVLYARADVAESDNGD